MFNTVAGFNLLSKICIAIFGKMITLLTLLNFTLCLYGKKIAIYRLKFVQQLFQYEEHFATLQGKSNTTIKVDMLVQISWFRHHVQGLWISALHDHPIYCLFK